MAENEIVARYPAMIVMRHKEMSSLAPDDYYDAHMILLAKSDGVLLGCWPRPLLLVKGDRHAPSTADRPGS
jgi:hypothetical protein